MSVHVHAPRAELAELRRMDCPNCGPRAFFATFFVPWYGWDSTCLRCGDRWQDGEWMERPFERGWREKSKAGAKARYRRFKRLEARL